MNISRLPDATRPARQLWRAIWPNDHWPKGWRVIWVERFEESDPEAMASGNGEWQQGETDYRDMLVRLSWPATLLSSQQDQLIHGHRWREFFKEYPPPEMFGGVIETAIHELIHLRHRRLEHGLRFNKLVAEAKRRLMEA